MRPRPPPVAALAVAFGLGCALTLSGALSALPAPALLLATLLLIGLWTRPEISRRVLAAALVAAALAGVLRTEIRERHRERDCRFAVADGWSGPVAGLPLAPPGAGAVPFRVERGLGGCHREVRAYLDEDLVPGPDGAGTWTATGRWHRLPARTWTTPETAGYLVLSGGGVPAATGSPGASTGAEPTGAESTGAAFAAEPAPSVPERLARGSVRYRTHLQRRLAELYGPVAPVTEALILARKEGLEPELRDAFARAGIAHLLAISGFHVGIVAGLLLVVGRGTGLGPVRAPLLAAGGAWAYVLFIGSPDAAVRAALILGLLCVGRLRGRPVSALGALAASFLLFLTADPGALGRAGFQLSFAGTAALILWSRPWSREASDLLRARLPEAVQGRWITAVGAGIGTGVAATIGTLPLVGWHFGQVPLLGIPATLLLGPLVALAIPGVLASLLIDVVAPGPAAFLAGGVGWILTGVVEAARWVAGIQGEAGWVTSAAVLCGIGGAVLGIALFRTLVPEHRHRGRSPWPLRATITAGAAAGVLLAPLITGSEGRGVVEIAAIDVGQGDAIAIRSPAGRWALIDTGPRSQTFDAGRQRVIPFLRRAGVERLEAIILTHPDLDHIGGAPAILREMEVGGVLDPGRIMGRRPFEETLATARERGVGWWPAGEREVLDLDGMTLEILYPEPARALARPPRPAGTAETTEIAESAETAETAEGGAAEGRVGGADLGVEANDLSVVLLLRFGRFSALLTGDAPASVEESVLGRIEGPVQLLKVGHHGSRTSTSPALLEALRPEVAVIPVGWRNRYGHPHDEVVARLRSSGVRILRTDTQGSVIVRAAADGSWSARLPDRRSPR